MTKLQICYIHKTTILEKKIRKCTHIRKYSIFPPQKTECVRICPEYPHKYAQEFGSKISPFSKRYIHFHIFTSYSSHIGMILVIYSYNIQKTSNIEYFALFSRIFNINTPPVQNSKIFENSYSGILVSYSAYSPRLARPQNMQNMQ